MTTGMYVLRSGDMDYHKIGWTGNLSERVAVLQVGNPLPLNVVRFVASDDPHIERRVLKVLKLWGYHAHGEWFEAPSTVIAEALAIVLGESV